MERGVARESAASKCLEFVWKETHRVNRTGFGCLIDIYTQVVMMGGMGAFNEKLYFITPIENIPSIMEHGILSYKKANKLPNSHGSVALQPVQEKRDKISVPNGRLLHEYANVYFNPRNAMMYLRKDLVDTLCVVVVSAKILRIPDVVISDMNAAALYARFKTPDELGTLDFGAIYAKNWNHQDPELKAAHKRLMCAEVLVPDRVPPEAILSVYVGNDAAQKALVVTGFPSEKIKMKPYFFFI